MIGFKWFKMLDKSKENIKSFSLSCSVSALISSGPHKDDFAPILFTYKGNQTCFLIHRINIYDKFNIRKVGQQKPHVISNL